MAKKKDKDEAAGLPDDTPKVLMSESQQKIAALVEAAGDAPVVEDVRELSVRLKMVIPKIIKENNPDRAYRWIALENIDQELPQNGGVWVPVNRMNHPKVDPGLFGVHGGITYKNQNILCFTRRAIPEAIEKRTIEEFDLKVKTNVENLERQVGEIKKGGRSTPAAVVERVEDPGEGPGDQALVSDEEYDFGDTGTDGH